MCSGTHKPQRFQPPAPEAGPARARRGSSSSSSQAAEWSVPLSFSAGKWGSSFFEMVQGLQAAFSDQSGQMVVCAN
ncbi:hypothetical protein Mapa_006574 [Marchantia paleacea]|nr:hypothetical protein Mapa_006574 [Marchantia paleacea]